MSARPGKLTPKGLHWNGPATRVVVRHEGEFLDIVKRRRRTEPRDPERVAALRRRYPHLYR